jgi:hypothetical protein
MFKNTQARVTRCIVEISRLALLAPALVRLTRSERSPDVTINPPGAHFLETLPLLMSVARVPGIAMSVVHGERIVWEHHAGVADTRTGTLVSSDTLWPAASLGKPVFAYAALRLVDAKKLDLDAPLKADLPDYAPDDPRGNRITARHVLSHSSGLPNWRESDDERLVPAFEPGTRFRYSGEGYSYLQRVVAGHDGDNALHGFLAEPRRSSARGSEAAEQKSRQLRGRRHNRPTDYLWHWGDNGSWKNFALVQPASRSAIVIFANGSHGLNVAQRVVRAATGLDHAAFWWL